MSVSFTITWPDGTRDDIPLGTYRTVSEGWRPLARSLGLALIPEFSDYLAVRPEDVPPLLVELAAFRQAVVERHPDDLHTVERIDRLAGAVERLGESHGWEASAG